MKIITAKKDVDNKVLLKKCYEQYFDDLLHYAKAITKSSDVAKDVVAEVFFDLIKSGRDINFIHDMKAYLFRSVKNGCIKQLSKDPVQFDCLRDDYEFRLIEEFDPEEIMMNKQLDDFVMKSVNNLSPHCQLVFKMLRLHHKSYEEVANELDISVNTVRNHLVSATKYLRQEIEKYYNTGTRMVVINESGYSDRCIA